MSKFNSLRRRPKNADELKQSVSELTWFRAGAISSRKSFAEQAASARATLEEKESETPKPLPGQEMRKQELDKATAAAAAKIRTEMADKEASASGHHRVVSPGCADRIRRHARLLEGSEALAVLGVVFFDVLIRVFCVGSTCD